MVGCGRVVAVHQSVAVQGPPQRGSFLSAVCCSRWSREQVLFSRLLVQRLVPARGPWLGCRGAPCANVQPSGAAGSRRACLFTRSKKKPLPWARTGVDSRRSAFLARGMLPGRGGARAWTVMERRNGTGGTGRRCWPRGPMHAWGPAPWLIRRRPSRQPAVVWRNGSASVD